MRHQKTKRVHPTVDIPYTSNYFKNGRKLNSSALNQHANTNANAFKAQKPRELVQKHF